MEDFIRLDDVKHGHIYHVRGRNISVGAWNATEKLFVGIRVKFGSKFLDEELGAEPGVTVGTALAIAEIGAVSDESIPLHSIIRHSDGTITHNDALFEVLASLEPIVEGLHLALLAKERAEWLALIERHEARKSETRKDMP